MLYDFAIEGVVAVESRRVQGEDGKNIVQTRSFWRIPEK